MTSLVSPALREYAIADDRLPDYPSSVQSGIVGDLAHRDSNTYHFSIEDLRNSTFGSYTNRYPDDAAPPGKWSRQHVSATDKSMATADMIKEWNRWVAVFNNRAVDPRAKFVAEYIGWNGVGEAERLDFQGGRRTISDKSHKWHSHKARRRRYFDSFEANRAFLSIDRGESIQQYLGETQGDDTMFFVKFGTDPAEFLSDGKSAIWVQNAQHHNDLVTLGNEKLIDLRNTSARQVGNKLLIGEVRGPLPPGWTSPIEDRDDAVLSAVLEAVKAIDIELSDEQIAKLASAIGQNPLNRLTADDVLNALRDRLAA